MSESQEPGSTPASSPSLVESIKALLLTFVDSLHTRIEIASTEIEEERERLEEILLLGVACVFCICMGVLLASLFVVAYFWDTLWRNQVVAFVTLFYLVCGGIFVCIIRSKLRHKPRLFATTLSELAKDRDRLQSKTP